MRGVIPGVFVLCGLLLMQPLLSSQGREQETGEQAKKKKKKKKQPKGWYFTMKQRPSVRHGSGFRADFRIKMHGDFESVSDDPDPARPVFDLRRKRAGIEGTLPGEFEYEIEYELGADRNWLRDGYLNWRRYRWLQVQGGKFKLPFGRDQLTGPANLNFVFRSRAGALIAPGRDVGVMLHGPLLNRAVRYQAGVFRHDGENVADREDEATGGNTVAARLRFQPDVVLPLPKVMETLEVAMATAVGRVPPERIARGGIRGRTTFRETYFPRLDVHGRRTRWGAEVSWMPGPFSVEAEAVQMREQRLGQSIRGTDLPDVLSRGWYVAGTWLVTGEKKAGGLRPRKPLFTQGGFGAVELGVRAEALRFGSAEHPGVAFSTPRAANLVSASDRAWTYGVTWYVNRYVKIQGNFVRESVEAFDRNPLSVRQVFWSKVCRLQFVM